MLTTCCHCQQEITVYSFPELSDPEAEQQPQTLAGNGLDGFYQFCIDAGQKSDCAATYTRNNVGRAHQESLDGDNQV